jgi:hypothetical protein
VVVLTSVEVTTVPLEAAVKGMGMKRSISGRITLAVDVSNADGSHLGSSERNEGSLVGMPWISKEHSAGVLVVVCGPKYGVCGMVEIERLASTEISIIFVVTVVDAASCATTL